MTMPKLENSEYYQHQTKISTIAESLSKRVRQKLFNILLDIAHPNANTLIIDVGVTSCQRSDTNFFEHLYPYPERITAVGLEDASYLEEKYPGLRFIESDALHLPFPDKTFDLAVSWALIEHVGSEERQKQLLRELVRVSKSIFVTTPNRWYPVEFHTVTPLIHWLPPGLFRSILRRCGMPFYASEETLNLLDERQLVSLIPPGLDHTILKVKLFGFVSNLALFAKSI